AVMAMDDTTQQNAALVEQLTSASQSLKAQAQELMRQIEMFTFQERGTNGREVNPIGSGPPGNQNKNRCDGEARNRQHRTVDRTIADGQEPAGVGALAQGAQESFQDDFEEF
ncbi:MAG: hypothetical protein NNA20_13360, partial [Nitrospira sp.]|nr:hypothetical protein [Nitrospira sp.]